MKPLQDLVRDIPDFPKPGILFKDITPLLADPEAFELAIDAMSALARASGATHIVGIESRGFIFGTPVAHLLGLPFVPVRKPGKLPADTLQIQYELEYGTDALEIHRDALGDGARVVVIDDLLATGGTAEATCQLIEQAGGEVASAVFLIELSFLSGAERLKNYNTHALIKY